ncbi:MAG: hypothetical protein ABMA25_02305 [Ilumatobacteraceae bacterium]
MTDPTAEANEARERFASTKEYITADRSLSPEGKKERIAAAREAANAIIAKVRSDVEKAAAGRRAALELALLSVPTSVFGTPADKIAAAASYRDAITRAGMTVTPDELLALQDTAMMTGDKLLARATLAVGIQRGDIAAVDGYSAAHPQMEADVDELFEMTHTTTRNAVANAFRHELAFGPV